NVDTGVIDPNTTTPYEMKKNNFQPRLAFTYAPGKNVFRGGVGLYVGPGQTEDQIQPIESDRVAASLTSGVQYPVDTAALIAAFNNNPKTRAYAPRAYANDYSIPERIYQSSASYQRDLGSTLSGTVAYVGSQGRNLFIRS